MPHFIIDCSENILDKLSAKEIIQAVFAEAQSTGLFNPKDINVRLNPFKNYQLGNDQQEFITIFASIMEGRSIQKKNDLSKKIVTKLSLMFPELSLISMNIRDIEKASFINKGLL